MKIGVNPGGAVPLPAGLEDLPNFSDKNLTPGQLEKIAIISRSGGVTNEFTFTGGVAKNEAAVRELRKVIKENYGEVVININPDSIYTGALGAAEFARRAHVGQVDGSEQ